MAWRLRSFKGVATAVTLILAVFWTPLWVYNLAASVARLAGGFLMSNVRPQNLVVHPIKAAIRNVTVDYDELSSLITEFLQGTAVEPSVQSSFQDFLSRRAATAHPQLESSLDWLLTTYKFVFPFLVISMVAKLTGSHEEPKTLDPGSDAEEDAALAEFMLPSRVHTHLKRDSRSGSPAGPSTPMQQQADAQQALFERSHSRLRRESAW